MNITVYDVVNSKIVEMLEKGVVAWKRTWKKTTVLPMNLITKRPYTGVNFFILSFATSPYFLSFKQVQTLGGKVKKGSKAWPVVFFTMLETEDKDNDGKKRRFPMLRYYKVFCADDVEGIENKIPKLEDENSENTPNSRCESVVANMPNKPKIVFNGEPCYRVNEDTVYVPQMSLFKNSESYYAALFHELVHSTGNENRLNRTIKSGFGTEPYGKEELCAEMGAAYLCALTGIDNNTFDNSAAYISGWLNAIKENPRIIVNSASAAFKAVRYIIGETINENVE
jgi:antirestriction protein ArdC